MCEKLFWNSNMNALSYHVRSANNRMLKKFLIIVINSNHIRMLGEKISISNIFQWEKTITAVDTKYDSYIVTV